MKLGEKLDVVLLPSSDYVIAQENNCILDRRSTQHLIGTYIKPIVYKESDNCHKYNTETDDKYIRTTQFLKKTKKSRNKLKILGDTGEIVDSCNRLTKGNRTLDGYYTFNDMRVHRLVMIVYGKKDIAIFYHSKEFQIMRFQIMHIYVERYMRILEREKLSWIM